MKVFPISQGARYSSDFGDGRSGGRTHAGNDLFADEGTPLLAVDDGNARFGVDPLGGNVVNLFANDGTRYYYAHLSSFENASVGDHRAVRSGDVVGYLGHTGNAANTPNHLHFEIHPGNGDPIDPFSSLRAAPIRSAQEATSPSIVKPLLIGLGVALAAWAILEPQQVKLLLKKVTL